MTVSRSRAAAAAGRDTLPAAARRAASAAASTAAFRASVEERLRALEAELSEVKSRINGLLFLAAGTVLAQVVLHLFRW